MFGATTTTVATIAVVATLLVAVVVILVVRGGAASRSPASAPVATFPGGPVVAFYGDSYTLGTGASEPGKRWSTILSEDRGWNEVNPSVNGLGFVNNRSPEGDPIAGGRNLVDQVVEARPDIVFITMGLNDNFSFDRAADEIEAAIRADLTELDRKLPDARFIVVEPFWYTDARPDSVETIIGWVRDAADRIDADYIPGASRWIEGHPEWMAADGLHPNDRGYAEIAERMDAELRRLGL